ncbi:MAG: GAF domain-containing protein [Leptolyngbya sp. SIO1D8]|nr:GAF domain-containing protein [Leptolyngbya sp. SIO1D8]
MVSNDQSLPTQPLWPEAQTEIVGKRGLHFVMQRLVQTLERDHLIQETLTKARQQLAVDRVVLYYFYKRWQGQVTSEALAEPSLSILGSTGPDDCFNHEYATFYLEGRTRAIADIPTSDLHACHQEFLESLKVRASLVVPIRVQNRLWGLLIAHHCQGPHSWTDADIMLLQSMAQQLATTSAIQKTQGFAVE